MAPTKRAPPQAAVTLSNKSIPDLKDDAVLFKSQIVHLKTDPHRDAHIEKRRYEEANPTTVDWSKRMPHRSHAEFGGAFGVTTILVFSHAIIWYFTLCLSINSGDLILPTSFEDFYTMNFFLRLFNLLSIHSSPTVQTCVWYWTFLLIQGIFAVTLPGIVRLGEPLPSLQGGKLTYICNAISAYWVTFISFALAHYFGIWDYTQIVDNIAPLATTAMLTADAFALAIYFNTFGTGEADPDISHNFFYDFFMGVTLNPRIGKLDIKMFFEIRVSWIMMTMSVSSAALKFYQTHGYLSNNMIIITAGICTYAYSVMKGEHLVLPTWDITTELYGNMLCFWNTALPFLYSAQAIYILQRDPNEIPISDPVFYVMMTILALAYYAFDTTNSQKSTFRQMYNGTFEPRPWAIPSFSYGTIENPRYLRTKAGSQLLMSGWYQYARKWHYTCDATMGLMYVLSAGFTLSFIPKFYIIFFVSMLFHRCIRDEEKCARKYGEDWVTYCQQVKYRFIPFIY